MKELNHFNRRRALWVLALLLAVPAPAAMAAADDMGDPVNGRKIATAWCAKLPCARGQHAGNGDRRTVIFRSRRETTRSLRYRCGLSANAASPDARSAPEQHGNGRPDFVHSGTTQQMNALQGMVRRHTLR